MKFLYEIRLKTVSKTLMIQPKIILESFRSLEGSNVFDTSTFFVVFLLAFNQNRIWKNYLEAGIIRCFQTKIFCLWSEPGIVELAKQSSITVSQSWILAILHAWVHNDFGNPNWFFIIIILMLCECFPEAYWESVSKEVCIYLFSYNICLVFAFTCSQRELIHTLLFVA